MDLNKLESRFFDDILNTELDVPVHATLEYQGDAFDVIVVPEVAPKGYFRLKYYNAPAYVPETQYDDCGNPFKSWSTEAAFGINPVLEQAWLNSDPVNLQMYPSPLPFNRELSPKLDGIVLYAAPRHRGALGLGKNRAVVRKAPLKRAEFCIVALPDLKSHIRQPVDLASGDGWNIKLSRDEELTGNLVSHTGLIERSEGSEYGIDELEHVLQGFKYFLAFAAGAFCLPTVVIGYDSQSQPVWGEIGRFETDRHRTANWFSSPVPDGAVLEDLFPRFWRKWKTNKNEITALIECYVHSNVMRQAGIPKDAVAKSYTGLEILVSLVLQKTIRGDSAKPIYDELFNQHIPNVDLSGTGTPSMSKLRMDLGIKKLNGPYLLNSVRNFVAHPLKPKTKAKVKQEHLGKL